MTFAKAPQNLQKSVDAHQHHLNRLTFEFTQRKQYANKLLELKNKKKALLELSQQKKKSIDNLQQQLKELAKVSHI